MRSSVPTAKAKSLKGCGLFYSIEGLSGQILHINGGTNING